MQGYFNINPKQLGEVIEEYDIMITELKEDIFKLEKVKRNLNGAS